MQNITTRRSIRTFTGENLTDLHKEEILDYISDAKNLRGINGNRIRIELRESNGTIGGKIGTYGFIKNAPAFLILIAKDTKASLFDCGYVFEKMVLFLQERGLGTCWMGGTFTKKQLMISEKLDDDLMIPIISPVGYAANTTPLKEKLIRKLAKADNRKDFNLLFHQNDFNTPITSEKIIDLLEMVRLAPSASNKQPWRVVMTKGNIAHFYIQRDPKYAGAKLQIVDMGICVAHYMLVSKKNKVIFENPNIELPNKNCEYLLTIK